MTAAQGPAEAELHMAQEAPSRGSFYLQAAASPWLRQALLALALKPVAVFNPARVCVFLNLYMSALLNHIH